MTDSIILLFNRLGVATPFEWQFSTCHQSEVTVQIACILFAAKEKSRRILPAESFASFISVKHYSSDKDKRRK